MFAIFLEQKACQTRCYYLIKFREPSKNRNFTSFLETRPFTLPILGFPGPFRYFAQILTMKIVKNSKKWRFLLFWPALFATKVHIRKSSRRFYETKHCQSAIKRQKNRFFFHFGRPFSLPKPRKEIVQEVFLRRNTVRALFFSLFTRPFLLLFFG